MIRFTTSTNTPVRRIKPKKKRAKKAAPDFARITVFDQLVYGDKGHIIYVLCAGDESLVKIGHTSDLVQRQKDLQTGQDKQIRVFWAIRMARDDAVAIERDIHKELEPTLNHRMGEWYDMWPQVAVAVVLRHVKARGCESCVDLLFGTDRGFP